MYCLYEPNLTSLANHARRISLKLIVHLTHSVGTAPSSHILGSNAFFAQLFREACLPEEWGENGIHMFVKA